MRATRTSPAARRAATATWGHPVNRAERWRKAKLKKWTPYRSGSLLGFCSVELPSGLVISDLRIMTGAKGLWVAMPAQRQLDREGNPRLDANGKPIFNQILELRDRATADRFGAMVRELIRSENPEALSDGGG